MNPLPMTSSADTPSALLRERLLQRVARSAAAASAFVTVRASRVAGTRVADGVATKVLYDASDAHQGRRAALRPGEPLRVQLIELDAGASWARQAAPRCRRELLVLRGRVQVGTTVLAERDYLVAPAGAELAALVAIDGGAVLYLREARDESQQSGDEVAVVRDAEAGWADYAPGIKRRLLWQHAGEAAMLYLADPGAAVPRHRHGHDEECLMVHGDVFLDDLLLRTGDWQLAPAGTGHEGVSTDTGGVLYAHGDLELDLID
jgi:quercetin dioxygenase-like cupin family protein